MAGAGISSTGGWQAVKRSRAVSPRQGRIIGNLSKARM
jgi:hypothetical protein